MGFPEDSQVGRRPCKGYREGLESFSEEMVCTTKSKSPAGVSQQRLGLGEARIMQPNMQGQR